MRFYTNVQLINDVVLYRGYNNGVREIYKDKFSPTLFVPSNKPTKYKTLEGQCVSPIKFDRTREAKDFLQKYEDVDNFKIYGNTGYIYQYISEMYPEDEVKFDISKIKVTTLDIEVASENGFPDVESAAEEILLISIQDYSSKQIRTWGLGQFNNKQKNVIYLQLIDLMM